ncbi:MAG: hypothetical protein A2508_00060 [Candidatus Lambdaproteobacteria bacterium RIFOXYD12_FULL_49_8]|nr:MAG: hypothetical protein A2508_00060 [Candidatus Lambdaproteobacteria bacterium RIFOXYD12_FULL_49_8]
MSGFNALRELPEGPGYGPGDVFVLFGELFARGYANGLVEQAKERGMTLIGATVGRRDKDNVLRALDPDELAQAEANLGGKILNYPLWAGFDMDAPAGGVSPADMIAKVKPTEWQDFKLDWDQIKAAQEAGINRFRTSLTQMVSELSGLIPKGANVLFAHTMAGGIPKAKVFLVLINRAVKGSGERYLPSVDLWEHSDLGHLAALNYDAITADTFLELLNATGGIREQVTQGGGRCSYSGYGYHGTEILVGGKYQWQTYSPYLPGWSKKRLEDHARQAFKQGIKACIYNCPEIRTNSSDLFSGVELPLYPLLSALIKEEGSNFAYLQTQICQDKLVDEETIENLLNKVDAFHTHPLMQPYYADFDGWPKHNTREMAEYMLEQSDLIMALNRDKKDLVTDHLSNLVLESSGRIMFKDITNPKAPVQWLGHDIIAKDLNGAH